MGLHTHTRRQTQASAMYPRADDKLASNDRRREGEGDREWVKFVFHFLLLLFTFALLSCKRKFCSPLQLPDNCSLLNRRGRNNLKIHNFISFAVAPGVYPATDSGVFVQNRGRTVWWLALHKDVYRLRITQGPNMCACWRQTRISH